MTGEERAALDFASRILAYPDYAYYCSIPEMELEAGNTLGDKAIICLKAFLDAIVKKGALKAQEDYVAAFDQSAGTSLYLSWHRYGNDRGQGKALAALNGLYRSAGFEPEEGSMPDYLPRMLEFMANAEDWAISIMLDGFGAEINGIIENLKGVKSIYAPFLELAIEPLKLEYPAFFAPRTGADSAKQALQQMQGICRNLNAQFGILPKDSL